MAALFPQPIKFESRRRRIQRFLILPKVSIPVLWFPIIKYILRTHFNKKSSQLILAIDRTQWRDKNLFMVSVIWSKRAIPIYWRLLDKRGSSNLREQKALLYPVLRLLKGYEVVVLGDREFRSVRLAQWLDTQGVYFALRQKKSTYIQQPGQDDQRLDSLGLAPGMKMFLTGVFLTKQKGFHSFNLAAYWKRKYRLKELGRTERRHSSFWVGLSGYIWVAGMEFLSDLVNKFWQLTPNKLPYFQRGLRAMELIQSTF